MFLTDAQIVQSVADLLKQPAANLPAYLGTTVSPGNVIVEAHAAAYNDLLGILLGRGYTVAQVTAWDQGAFYERMQSLYWVMVNAAGTFPYDDRFIKDYDRRKDLLTVAVSIGGVFVAPNALPDSPGTIGQGDEDTAGDVFVFRRRQW